MRTILATIVLLVIVLGLIAGPINDQTSGIKDTGDQGKIEMKKVNLIAKNSDYVTGNIVRNDYDEYGSLTVDIFNVNGSTMGINEVFDKAIFRKSVDYDANGNVGSITFRQVDLSN